MPRKGSVAKRDVLPDPMYNSKLVTRLVKHRNVRSVVSAYINIIVFVEHNLV